MRRSDSGRIDWRSPVTQEYILLVALMASLLALLALAAFFDK